MLAGVLGVFLLVLLLVASTEKGRKLVSRLLGFYTRTVEKNSPVAANTCLDESKTPDGKGKCVCNEELGYYNFKYEKDEHRTKKEKQFHSYVIQMF